ncbi:hypothetical protein [Streptomyces sp. NPDC060194]|uniref:hypothetical protein n=1 Tax=Streptomyces sp. NPDC060194 TaxID=3347069 RepID=UPI00364A1E53
MTYTTRDWWQGLALVVVVTAACTVALSALLAALADGRTHSIPELLVLVPSLMVGLAAGRAHRRRREAA